jgi:mitogen-activated protein kinase 1/3
MPLYATQAIEVEKGDGKSLCERKKNTFQVPVYLELVKKVGGGAYGKVASFLDKRTGDKIAVKKITSAFENLVDGKRILREVKLLRSLDHPNIIRIFDMYPPEAPDFDDIYIVTDLMDTDLHQVIYSPRVRIEEEHQRWFTYYILKGLAYLHSADIIHRDLKPANVLVNNDCDLKICDFGLSRVSSCAEDGEQFGQTDYVVTRWYRAPEVVLLASQYTKSIDIWAVGCIIYELIRRQPLFRGKDYKDQIHKIVAALGTPQNEELGWLPKDGAGYHFLRKLPPATKVIWSQVLPEASAATCQAIESMLRFDPVARCEALDAMRLPFFEQLHQEAEVESNLHVDKVDWSFDDFEPTRELLQKRIYDECVAFNPEILQRDRDLLCIQQLLDDPASADTSWISPTLLAESLGIPASGSSVGLSNFPSPSL